MVDLGEAVRNLEPMIHRIIGEEMELRMVLAAGLWKTRVDPGQLELAVMNLVVNARDAMSKGGVLTLETSNAVLDQAHADEHVGVSPGQHVMLAVSDTGAGMDPPFARASLIRFSRRKRSGRG